MARRTAEVLRVQPGEVFYPFQGKKIDPNEASPNIIVDDLVRRRFNLGSTAGRVALMYDLGSGDHFPYLFDKDGLEQPLGGVKFSVAYGESGKATYEAIPLSLQLDTWPTSLKQVRELKQLQLEVGLGEKNYYMGFSDKSFNNGLLDEEQMATRLKDFGYARGAIESYDGQLFNSQGNPVDVLLPSDERKLATVRMRFVPAELTLNYPQ